MRHCLDCGAEFEEPAMAIFHKCPIMDTYEVVMRLKLEEGTSFNWGWHEILELKESESVEVHIKKLSDVEIALEMGSGKRLYYLTRSEMERKRGNYANARKYELLAELLPLEEE